MLAYLQSYRAAWSLAQAPLHQLEVGFKNRIKYAIKSGNLAVCFLGFSINSGAEFIRRSAELGLFDLVSDGLDFEPRANRLFTIIVREYLADQVSNILLELMERKKNKIFSTGGLERGVDALRVVIKHLKSERAWTNYSDIFSVGVFLQVVDDLLDFRNDIARGELNFLRHEDLHDYIPRLIEWDYREQFRYSKYPLVLFYAIERAKSVGAAITKNAIRQHASVDHHMPMRLTDIENIPASLKK